ncbi:MAG: chemotaxis protein CheV [Myxococcota bacterium]
MSASKRDAILLEAGTNEAEFLEFKVRGHHFGVNVHKVLQAVVWNADKLVRTPGAGSGYLGQFSLRGKPISVISLQAQLNLPVLQTSTKPLLLVMEFNQRITGFLIDEIVNIHRISWTRFNSFEQVARFGEQIDVVGSINVGERVVQILDLEATMGRMDTSMAMREDIAVESEESDSNIRERIRMLYAEDSPTIRRITLHLLKKAGYTQIHTCATGAEAYEVLKRADREDVDILLTDIEMPEMDGLALCRKIREGGHHQDLPVVFYSSMINEQMAIKCKSAGGDRSFAKPNAKEIADGIEALFRERYPSRT